MGVAKKADGWHPIDAADSRQPQFIERKANCLSMRASSGDFVPGRVELGGTPSVKGQGLRPTWVDNLAHSRTCCSCIEAMAWGLVISEPLHGWFITRGDRKSTRLNSRH